MKLTENEMLFLISELDKTPEADELELKYITASYPQLRYTYQSKKDKKLLLASEKLFFYSLKNKILNKFLSDKFEENVENLFSIHRLLYGVDDMAKRHKDGNDIYKTISIILSNSFTGGDMYVDDKKVEMNELGNYIIFNGGSCFHEVKKIESGFRDTLVVWFSTTKPKFKLI